MSRSLLTPASLGACLSVLAIAVACGSSSSTQPPGGSSGSSSGASGSGGSSGASGSSGGFNTSSSSSGSGGGSSSGGDGGIPCPSGLQCNVQCSGGGTTSISGTVYDPAGKNPIYNVAVYVPAVPLVPLPKGVPTGADACSCGALFQSGAITNTTTGVDGKFTLTNVPVGSSVPLVIQIGKWRRQFDVNVTSCSDNAQADKTLKLPGSVPAGDTNTNMPDIAVSTGFADTLECLMHRIGLPTTEYVAGGATGGHVHIFSGGNPTKQKDNNAPELPGMSGAPTSWTSLWDSQKDLMPFDIVLLSCEGGETHSANPSALEGYLNAGGRAFASHFHYAWFSGPLTDTTDNSYTPPSDWQKHLATWAEDGANDENGPVGGIIDTTLNGGSGTFAKGQFLQQWLTNVKALGTNGVAAGELAITQPRYNASVTATNAASQPWITSDSTANVPGATLYFSFDTPVNAPAGPDGGAPQYCGRAVFSDLHVGSAVGDTGVVPSGCASQDLSPQEKALEFMLFDLSSCVIPDTVAPPLDGGLPPPPIK